MHKRITWTIILIAIFVLLGGLSFGVGMYFDYLWFLELGKTAIFTTTLYAKSMLGSGTLLISFLFLYINFIFANRGPGLIEIGIPTPAGQITAYRVQPQTVQRAAGVLAALIGCLMGVGQATYWEHVWQWLHKVNFNVTDPVFGKDISFYFFSLPFLQDVVRLGLILGFLALIGVAVLYYFKGVLTWSNLRESRSRNRVGVHISLLASLIFIMLAFSAYLDRYDLLFGIHEVFSGAGYADLHARMPMLAVLAIAALVGALLWIFNAFWKNNRPGMAAIVLYLVVMFLGSLYPAFIQKFIVSPSELDRENPQIAHNIKATLQAYGLTNVEERNLSGDKALTEQDVQNNAATIHSIRLWDREPLLDALKHRGLKAHPQLRPHPGPRPGAGFPLSPAPRAGGSLGHVGRPDPVGAPGGPGPCRGRVGPPAHPNFDLCRPLPELDPEAVMAALRLDKKRQESGVPFVLLPRLGETLIKDEVDLGLVAEVLKEMMVAGGG